MKIFNQKNSSNKQNIFGNEEINAGNFVWKKDTTPGKLNEILDIFNNIINKGDLREYMKVLDSKELPKMAKLVYNELEKFLKENPKF